ncbi:MAG: hypothetical protein NTY64_17675 [Deltaproteobacteria bacterium]|nr:hypothetical protein [Deltaproteobacteria bacterium]
MYSCFYFPTIPGSIIDGFVKSPSAALHCILRRCGVLPSTLHSSGIVRLTSGAFYFAIHSDGFLRDHHYCQSLFNKTGSVFIIFGQE